MIIKSGIYKIINKNNGRYYIGSSINIKNRWNEHKRTLKQNKHDNNFLQKSWNKHGEESFLFEVIEYVLDLNKLLEREQFYLDLITYDKKMSYNLCKTAGNMLGFKHSDETKNKMSKSRIGNKNSLGNKHTDETKNKMSNSHIGLKHEEKTKILMINKSKKDILKSIKYKTKISNEIRTELLNKYSSGSYSTRKLSELYGISKSTIWNIVRKDN
jgi:group I intron endonuclease